LRWTLPARSSEAQRAKVLSALPQGRWFGLDEALAAGLPAPLRKFLTLPR
jgi:A/G-specific adenine glycosylase